MLDQTLVTKDQYIQTFTPPTAHRAIQVVYIVYPPDGCEIGPEHQWRGSTYWVTASFNKTLKNTVKWEIISFSEKNIYTVVLLLKKKNAYEE